MFHAGIIYLTENSQHYNPGLFFFFFWELVIKHLPTYIASTTNQYVTLLIHLFLNNLLSF